MRTIFRALLAVVIALTASVGPVSAATNAATIAQATQSGTITGHVTGDNGAAISGATVNVAGAGTTASATTDDSGAFSVSVPPGLYTVTVSKGGYQQGSSDVTVESGGSTSADVTLTAASLSSLSVIGRTSSAAANGARFNISSVPSQSITQAQLIERNTPDLTSILQELPGVTIPRATANPNQSFIIRGLRYETRTLIDGHPVSSGTGGTFLTNYTAAPIFGGVEVEKGPGFDPISGTSGAGSVNLKTPDFAAKTGAFLQVGMDNYGGTLYSAILDLNVGPKVQFVFGHTFSGYRGPTYGLQEPDFTGAAPAYGTFSPPSGLTNDIIQYINDFSDTYSLNAELAKMRVNFSQATSFTAEFLGLEGRFDPQGGAYGQFLGYGIIPQCLNGSTGANGAACTVASKYNAPNAQGLIGQSVPLYAFYPGSDVRQNQPNFNAELRTTLGNDTILFRPYTAAINRLIDGTQENTVPGDAGAWYQVTNSANCLVASNNLGTANAQGPCYAAGANPYAAFVNDPNTPHVFNATGAALTCTAAAPCYTSSTAQNNSGQYGFGAPYTTLELDKLFGYTFSWIHPAGNNTYSISFDHYLDDTTAYVNDASPLAAGCTFVLGSGLANTPGSAGYQSTCPLTALRPSPISVPETASSVSTLSGVARLQLMPKLEFDFGAYFTHYLINAQQESPALLAADTASFGATGRTGAIPVVLSPIQNAASHFDPHFGLFWRPTRDWGVRFTAGSSITIPYAMLVSGFTTYAQGATNTTVTSPNPNLNYETLVTLDLGSDWRTPDGTVLSADIYNTVVHNPWLAPKVLICPGSPQCSALNPGALPGLEPTLQTYTSQTLNGAQQYAQGVEFTITREPAVGFGYRVNTSFERNYYLGTPASFFASPQTFFNGYQFASTGSGSTSVPYSKGYAEVRYATENKGLFRFGADYEGPNNEYNAPAFWMFDAGIQLNTGFHDVLLGAAVENLTGVNFGANYGRGVEYQGLEPETYTNAPGAYPYTLGTFNSALVAPPPTTYRITLTKRF